MSTKKELDEFINQEYKKREAQIKTAIINYFTDYYIYCHEPWRAIKTSDKCEMVPFNDGVYGMVQIGDELHAYKLEWPNLPEYVIRKSLIKLGFEVSRNGLHVAVPEWKNDEQLTFAQKWVKKINDNYTKYCRQQKELAKKLISQFISELISSSPETIQYFPEYTLFKGFKFSKEINSSECLLCMTEMLKNKGIEECWTDDGHYVGIIVRNNHH